MAFQLGQIEQPSLLSLLDESGTPDGAVFSPWRRWSEGSGRCAFVLLNPSSADELHDDPTVARCIERARRWGFAGADILNIFAIRGTDPSILREFPDPVGPENDRWILDVASKADRVIVGWGAHGVIGNRGNIVLSMLREAGITAWCLGTTKTGMPRHPLYIPYSKEAQSLTA